MPSPRQHRKMKRWTIKSPSQMVMSYLIRSRRPEKEEEMDVKDAEEKDHEEDEDGSDQEDSKDPDQVGDKEKNPVG